MCVGGSGKRGEEECEAYGEKGQWGGGARESCGGMGKTGQLWGRGEEGAVGGGEEGPTGVELRKRGQLGQLWEEAPLRGGLPTASHWWLEEGAGPLPYLLRNRASLVESASLAHGVGSGGEPLEEGAPSLAGGMFLELPPLAGKHSLALLWRPAAEAAPL